MIVDAQESLPTVEQTRYAARERLMYLQSMTVETAQKIVSHAIK